MGREGLGAMVASPGFVELYYSFLLKENENL